jgi:hypothetical protein
MHRNSRVDYWSEILDLNLDSDHLERIEKYQEKIFNERVDREVLIAFDDILEFKESERIIQIEKKLKLINGFFNGDLSKITLKRLKKIISFSKPKKVILAHDELVKSNCYIAYVYLIYSIGPPMIYSKYFVASFFIRYLSYLEAELKFLKENSLEKNLGSSDLSSLLTKDKKKYVLQMLEDLSITVDGISVLTPRKKGAIRGVVEALREKMIVPNIGISKLCNLMALEINLELNSVLDASTTSEKYKKEALNYISNHALH